MYHETQCAHFPIFGQQTVDFFVYKYGKFECNLNTNKRSAPV